MVYADYYLTMASILVIIVFLISLLHDFIIDINWVTFHSLRTYGAV